MDVPLLLICSYSDIDNTRADLEEVEKLGPTRARQHARVTTAPGVLSGYQKHEEILAPVDFGHLIPMRDVPHGCSIGVCTVPRPLVEWR